MKNILLKSLLLLGFFFSVRGASAQIELVNHWESVVYASDTFNYYIGESSNPPADWFLNSFDASGWPQGPAGFGYNDGDDATILPDGTLSVFVRRAFELTDASQIALAILNLDFDDGFVAWINGVEVARQGLGSEGDSPAYNLAATDHEAVVKDGQPFPYFRIEEQKLVECLRNGTNILAIQVNNLGPGSSDMSCIPYLSIGVKYSGQVYRTTPGWFVAPVPPPPPTGYNLPLIEVQTNGNYIQPDNKITVGLKIIDNGPGNLNWSGNPANVYEGKAGIEIRGSSSSGFDKKNYGLELRQADGTDSAVSLLGMPAESDWILHGPYSDKVLVRNHLAYTLFTRLGNYAPRTRFAEMKINDQYQGVYVLLEKIKRDKNRVNIAKLEPTENSGLDLTGGYIFKIDRSSDGSNNDGWYSQYTGSSGQLVFYVFHYPKWEDITPEQTAYIKSQVDSFEMVLKSTYYKDPVKGYRNYIDVRSFIDYFLLVELSKNTDGFRLSTFLHKDRDDRDPRIHMGPVWDYDIAFGNANYGDADITTGWKYSYPDGGWGGNPFWWSRFLSDPWYTGQLKCRWLEMRETVLSDESIQGIMDSAAMLMGPAIDRNFEQWQIHNTWVWPNVYVGSTYQEDADFMKGWISTRAAWLDSHMPGSCVPSNAAEVIAQELVMKVYPNPAIEYVSVSIFNPAAEKLDLRVYNIHGQLVRSVELNEEVLQDARFALPPGVYLLQLQGGSSYRTEKLVVQ
ncbi:MAG: CotH kinase family protein [Bacteroidales bacterium]